MPKIIFVSGLKKTALNTAIPPLIDNSGGVAVDGTIAAVTTTPQAADAIKELATQLNLLTAACKAAGIIT